MKVYNQTHANRSTNYSMNNDKTRALDTSISMYFRSGVLIFLVRVTHVYPYWAPCSLTSIFAFQWRSVPERAMIYSWSSNMHAPNKLPSGTLTDVLIIFCTWYNSDLPDNIWDNYIDCITQYIRVFSSWVSQNTFIFMWTQSTTQTSRPTVTKRSYITRKHTERAWKHNSWNSVNNKVYSFDISNRITQNTAHNWTSIFRKGGEKSVHFVNIHYLDSKKLSEYYLPSEAFSQNRLWATYTRMAWYMIWVNDKISFITYMISMFGHKVTVNI